MTDTNTTADIATCTFSVKRGVGRKAHYEFCGRVATHVSLGVNFYCKRHANTKISRWAQRAGTLVEIS